MVWYTNFWFLFGVVMLCIMMIFAGIAYMIYKRREIKDFTLRNLAKKHFLRAYIFNANGQLDVYPTTIFENRFTKGNSEYIVSPEHLKFHGKVAVGFWFEGCPFPVDYNLTEEVRKEIPVKIQASSFHDILNNKIIKDILKQAQTMQLMFLITCAIGVVVILIFAKQYGFIDWAIHQQASVPP